MKIYENFLDLVGNTPILKCSSFSKSKGLKTPIYTKLESFNPAGSAKDRAAKYMLQDAFSKGVITKDTVIIEPTSGNTGIGLAAAAKAWGIRVILTMPDTMSIERINLLKAYGAEVILTEGKKGMAGAIKKAQELSEEFNKSFIPGQFTNPANKRAHFETTGPEIWRDTDGKVDIFIAGVGTGGTISGVGEYLKSKNPNIKIIAVEPSDSPVLSGGSAGAHKLQGIGAGFIPEILNTEIYDEVIGITAPAAYSCGNMLAKTEGILCGISSGAVMAAAAEVSARPENSDKMIVALLTDTGERYLSTGMFE